MSFGIAYAQVQDWGNCVADNGNGAPTIKCLEIVVGNLVFISSTIAILILFVMLIIGALRFITSSGNADKIKNAKSTLTYAFLGLILFVAAYLIINVIDILFIGGQGKLLRLEIPEF